MTTEKELKSNTDQFLRSLRETGKRMRAAKRLTVMPVCAKRLWRGRGQIKKQKKHIKRKRYPAAGWRLFLIAAGIFEMSGVVPGSILFIILTFFGFAAGEAGIMIGILSASLLLFLFPFGIGRIISLFGLFTRKPWAAVLTMVLYGLCLPGAFVLWDASPAAFVVYILYCAAAIWSAAVCYRGFKRIRRGHYT